MAVVAVGTMNEGKHQACRMALKEWRTTCSVVGVRASSGVPDQPMGLDETTLGAKNRATAALKAVDGARFGVGLESGLVVVDGNLFDFCSCAIFDGQRHYIGVSSMWMLPSRVAQALRTRGYNQCWADIGIEPDAEGDGVLGALSNGFLSRPKQMRESVHTAMLQFRNSQLWEEK